MNNDIGTVWNGIEKKEKVRGLGVKAWIKISVNPWIIA